MVLRAFPVGSASCPVHPAGGLAAPPLSACGAASRPQFGAGPPLAVMFVRGLWERSESVLIRNELFPGVW